MVLVQANFRQDDVIIMTHVGLCYVSHVCGYIHCMLWSNIILLCRLLASTCGHQNPVI